MIFSKGNSIGFSNYKVIDSADKTFRVKNVCGTGYVFELQMASFIESTADCKILFVKATLLPDGTLSISEHKNAYTNASFDVNITYDSVTDEFIVQVLNMSGSQFAFKYEPLILIPRMAVQ